MLSRRNLLASAPLALAASRLGWAEDDAHAFTEITKKSEESAARGVKWMLRTMHRDGGCGTDIGQPVTDIGCSAIGAWLWRVKR